MRGDGFLVPIVILSLNQQTFAPFKDRNNPCMTAMGTQESTKGMLT